MAKAILTAALLVASLSADAQTDTTGNSLYRQCGGVGTLYGQGVCDGYIAGVANGLEANGLICYPDKVTAEQAADVVRSYFDDHPADRQEGKYHLVTRALAEAFPCDGGE